MSKETAEAYKTGYKEGYADGFDDGLMTHETEEPESIIRDQLTFYRLPWDPTTKLTLGLWIDSMIDKGKLNEFIPYILKFLADECQIEKGEIVDEE